jgi:hypothetical protein
MLKSHVMGLDCSSALLNKLLRLVGTKVNRYIIMSDSYVASVVADRQCWCQEMIHLIIVFHRKKNYICALQCCKIKAQPSYTHCWSTSKPITATATNNTAAHLEVPNLTPEYGHQTGHEYTPKQQYVPLYSADVYNLQHYGILAVPGCPT